MTTSNRISVPLAVVCLLLGASTGFVSLSQPKRAFGGSSLFSTDASVDATAAAMDAVAAAAAAPSPTYDPAALKAYDEWRLQNAPVGMPAKDFDETEFRAFEETFVKLQSEAAAPAAAAPAAAAPAKAAATASVPILANNNNSARNTAMFDTNNMYPKVAPAELEYPAELPMTKAQLQVQPPKPNVAKTETLNVDIDGREYTFIPVNKLNAKHRSNVY